MRQKFLSRVRNFFSPPVISSDSLEELAEALEGRGQSLLGSWNGTEIDYAPLARCLTLGSSIVGQLLSSESLRVVDYEGNTVTKTISNRIRALVTEEPSGELEPAYTFWQQFGYDYLRHGNAVAITHRGFQGRLVRLERMNPLSIQVEPTNDATAGIYRLQSLFSTTGQVQRYFPSNGVVHARWPIPTTGNPFIGASPVTSLLKQIEIGRASDQYILDFFKAGPGGAVKNRTVITVEPGTPPEQVETFAKLLRDQPVDKPLLLLEGMGVHVLKVDPSNEKLTNLREFQVREIARGYGLPAPLMGEQITQWGSGIEELAKLAYRFGFRQHVDAILKTLTARILPKGMFFKIDEFDLLKGDTTALTQLLKLLLESNAISREELRVLVGIAKELPDGLDLVEESKRLAPEGGTSEQDKDEPNRVPRSPGGLRRASDLQIA